MIYDSVLSLSIVHCWDEIDLFSPVHEAVRIPSYPTGLKGFTDEKEKTDKRVFGEIDCFKDL
jgi:hypothetical protein